MSWTTTERRDGFLHSKNILLDGYRSTTLSTPRRVPLLKRNSFLSLLGSKQRRCSTHLLVRWQIDHGQVQHILYHSSRFISFCWNLFSKRQLTCLIVFFAVLSKPRPRLGLFSMLFACPFSFAVSSSRYLFLPDNCALINALIGPRWPFLQSPFVTAPPVASATMPPLLARDVGSL